MPGTVGVPPELTVIELVAVPKSVPLTALNVIVPGDDAKEAVPIPG